MSADRSNLPALLQLASAALPVGAFSHSLGLEAALEAGVVRDAASAEQWIADYLALALADGEAPLWRAQYAAWLALDENTLLAINDQLVAMRETAELRMESEQTGRSLALWLQALPQLSTFTETHRAMLGRLLPPAYASVHACASAVLDLDERDALQAMGWSLAENLTTAAVKLVPLGQIAGQAMLRRLASQLPAWVETAMARAPTQARNFTPMLGILSAHHETQYTRLFRS
ncbi:urease accessory protein [Rhodanobacter sp. K2T2]|uniref:urease accessory protein UreF n=1 Tax=Rhodanobacter sp. K2T2 TaxID=2723085 RepID=UPI0015C76244|nr:urease accessory UreF family protein [Rhodanobacter sp. K2T2]NYE27888.1 urease accessory protein [Rhodanobacter sp. K2T2]